MSPPRLAGGREPSCSDIVGFANSSGGTPDIGPSAAGSGPLPVSLTRPP